MDFRLKVGNYHLVLELVEDHPFWNERAFQFGIVVLALLCNYLVSIL